MTDQKYRFVCLEIFNVEKGVCIETSIRIDLIRSFHDEYNDRVDLTQSVVTLTTGENLYVRQSSLDVRDLIGMAQA